ncbi:cysteine peptidase family C39 domain-containing protein [Corallococcus sp. M7]
MSVNLSSNLLRTFQQLAEVKPAAVPQQTAQQVGLPEEKVVSQVEGAPTPVQTEQATDAFAAIQALNQAWANRFQPVSGASAQDLGVNGTLANAPQAPEIGGWDAAAATDPGVVKQANANDCGAAVAVMLGKELGTSKTQPASDKEKMAALESRFTQGQGTSPHELSNMLANQGTKVTHTSSKLDTKALDDALARGAKGAVMVDSSLVDPTTKPGETGRAHWVSVEGKDDQGRYLLKDPSTGSKIPVDAQRLADSVEISWNRHQGGGQMIVESAQGMSEAQAAQEGGLKAVTLGNTDGGGSRAMSNFGRESS